MSKQLRNTDLIELVETHNIKRSLTRLSQVKSWNNGAARRALYHAFTMSDMFNNTTLEKMRTALELP